MTIKNISMDREIGYASLTDTYGGQQLLITATPEFRELMHWWSQWKDVFNSSNPTVIDTLKQAKVLHEVSK